MKIYRISGLICFLIVALSSIVGAGQGFNLLNIETLELGTSSAPIAVGTINNQMLSTTIGKLYGDDIVYRVISLYRPIEEGRRGFGVNIVTLTTSGILGTTTGEDGTEFSGFFSDKQNGLLWSYGQKFKDSIYGGFTLKYLNRSLGEYTAKHVGVDLVLTLISDSTNSIVNFTLQDIYGDILWSTGLREDIKHSLKVDLSQGFFGDSLLLVASNKFQLGKENNFSFRVDLKPTKRITLSLGNKRASYSAGIGLSFDMLDISYAVKKEDLGTSQFIRFGMGF